MSRTVLAEVDGFTPVIDSVAAEVGPIGALVFGRVWRFCQMKDGVCQASVETIADGIFLGRTAVKDHLKALVEHGFLKDCSPDLRNHPHTYADTGKAGLYMGVVGGRLATTTYADLPMVVGRRGLVVGKRPAGGRLAAMKIDSKKDSNKQEGIENQKSLLLSDLESCARSVFFDNFTAWRSVEMVLENDQVSLRHSDGVFLVGGLGMKAAMFQDRYAKAFSRALAGVYNQPTEVIFQEAPC
jgi:hypothetical protein